MWFFNICNMWPQNSNFTHFLMLLIPFLLFHILTRMKQRPVLSGKVFCMHKWSHTWSGDCLREERTDLDYNQNQNSVEKLFTDILKPMKEEWKHCKCAKLPWYEKNWTLVLVMLVVLIMPIVMDLFYASFEGTDCQQRQQLWIANSSFLTIQIQG